GGDPARGGGADGRAGARRRDDRDAREPLAWSPVLHRADARRGRVLSGAIMKRASIFDFDGVLNAVARDAAKVFFESRLPISLQKLGARWDLYLRSRRHGDEEATDLWRAFLVPLCDEFPLSAEVRSELLSFEYSSMFEAYPDARPAAIEARRRGARIGVLSNMPFNNIDVLLQRSDLAGLVDAVLLPYI